MKNNRNRIISTAIILFLINLMAFNQKSTISYDLKQFELPYLKRHQLDLSFSVNSNGERSMFEYGTDSQDDSKADQISLYLIPHYRFYLNTNRIQSFQSVSVSPFDLSVQNSEDDETKSNSTGFSGRFTYNSENRYYFVSPFFIETDLDFSFHRRLSKSKSERFEEGSNNRIRSDLNKGNYGSLDIGIPVLFGYGRIERVEDARLAVYILNDLNKLNRLNHQPSEEEIYQLAQLISILQNERFFDARHKKIWEIQQLDSFLKETGLASGGDAAYFTLLNDNWDFAAGPARESGFRVSTGILPHYNEYYNYNHQETDYDTSGITRNDHIFFQTNKSIDALLRLKYELPVNLYWQLTLISDFSVGKQKHHHKNESNFPEVSEEKNSYSTAGSYFTAGLGYYPNSRTYLQTYVKYNFEFRDGKSDDNDFKYLDRDHDASLGLNGYYYISPQLRLSLTARMMYAFDDYSDKTDGTGDWLDRKRIDSDYHLSLAIRYSFL